jgi:hypothetical protein
MGWSDNAIGDTLVVIPFRRMPSYLIAPLSPEAGADTD